jgi:hypothetical protein
MTPTRWVVAGLATGLVAAATAAVPAVAADDSSRYGGATWYSKYQAVSGAARLCSGTTGHAPQLRFGSNVDASHECGAQSETSIAIDPSNPSNVLVGSNEIDRLPMRAMYSTDGGNTFTGVDLPLPPPRTRQGFDFGSDPAVAFDTRGNAYYSYIVVFFSKGGAVNGTAMAVARSHDHGRTWKATYFDPQTGEGQFDDKPYLAVDTWPSSPYRDRIYVAWDHATGSSSSPTHGNNVLVSHSTDGGVSFSPPVAASPDLRGKTGNIGADPFVAPDGTVHVAWHDYVHSLIAESSSANGGVSFGRSHVIAATKVPFDIAVPAINSRAALIYPSCGASSTALYCSWTDGSLPHGTDVLLSESTNAGTSWSAPKVVNTDPAGYVADQFNQWLAVDPADNSVSVAYYDTSADPTRKSTFYTLARSTNGAATFTRRRAANAPTDETCCSPSVDLGNQYGDYEGLAARNGIVRPAWTDRRKAVAARGLREEIFTTAIATR